jgi:hypothetical protein
MYRNGRASFHTNDGTCVMIHVRVLYTPDVKDEKPQIFVRIILSLKCGFLFYLH